MTSSLPLRRYNTEIDILQQNISKKLSILPVKKIEAILSEIKIKGRTWGLKHACYSLASQSFVKPLQGRFL